MSESPQGKITTQNASLLAMLREKSGDMNHNQPASRNYQSPDRYPNQSQGRTLPDDPVKVYIDSPIFPKEDEDNYKFVSTDVDDLQDSLQIERSDSQPLGKPPLPVNSRAGQFRLDDPSGASPTEAESYERSRLKNGAPKRNSSFGSNRSAQFVIRGGKENDPQETKQRPSWTPPSSNRSPMARRQSPGGYAERHRNRSRSGSRNNSAERKRNENRANMDSVQPVQPIETPFGKRNNTELEDEELREEKLYQSHLQEQIEVQKHETEHLTIPKLELNVSDDDTGIRDSLELQTFGAQKVVRQKQQMGELYDSLDATETHVNREAILRDSYDEYGMPEPDMDYNPYKITSDNANMQSGQVLYNSQEFNHSGEAQYKNQTGIGEETYRLLEQNQVARQPERLHKDDIVTENQTIPVARQGVIQRGQVFGNPVLMQGNLQPMILPQGNMGEGGYQQPNIQFQPVQYQLVPNVGFVPVMQQNMQPVTQGGAISGPVMSPREYIVPQSQNNQLLRGHGPQMYQGDAFYQASAHAPQEKVPERVSPQGHQEMQEEWYDAPQHRAGHNYGPDVYYSSPQHQYQHKPPQKQVQKAPPSPPKNNYIEENKKTFGKPKKENSYGGVFAKKKGASSAPNINRPSQEVQSPQAAQTEVNETPEGGVEQMWHKQAKLLSQHKNGKHSGQKTRKSPLYKMPSEGSGLNTAQSDGSRPRYVQPLQHRPAPKQAFNQAGQAIPEPVRSHIEPQRIQAQPITHTVYTDDGQKVSVDINLKMISPTPSHPAGGATLHSNPQHHPPPQFRPADYRPDDQHYNYHEAYDYPDYPTPHDNLPSEREAHTHRTYDSSIPSNVGSPYKVLPPISADQDSGTPRGRAHQRNRSKEKSPKDESPTRGTLQGSYRDEYEKQKAKKIEYKEYTLEDYRKLKKELKLGGLGPDLDNQTLKEKKEKIMKQQEYAKQVNYKNRQEVKTKAKVYEPEEEEDIMNKRKIALEYARNVPKPKVVVRMRNEETNTDPLLQQQQNIPAVVQIHDTRATSSGRVTEEDPELIGLQELKARHDREVAKVAQIRQKVESAT